MDARNNAQGLVQILDSVAPTPDPSTIAATLDAAPESIAALPPSPTPTPTHTPTVTPTDMSVSEAISGTALLSEGTAPVTATLTLEVTATPDESNIYVVKAGDSFLGIGASLNMAWQDIAAANGLSANSVLKIGQKLQIPNPTATPEPTATSEPTETPGPTATEQATEEPTATAIAAGTPTATRRTNSSAMTRTPTATQPLPTATATPKANNVTYRVKTGDTLSGIGLQFGIPWQDIAAANGLKATSRLSVGQELIIPLAGLPPTAVPTRRPAATATPVLPTPSPAPQVMLAAPVLGDPADGASYRDENAMIILNWSPVAGMPVDARYMVTIRYTQNGVPIESEKTTTATQMRFPALYLLADQPDRKYTWFVTVVQPTTDGKGNEINQPLSAPSTPHTLTWN
jgi:LysM repeat protein